MEINLWQVVQLIRNQNKLKKEVSNMKHYYNAVEIKEILSLNTLRTAQFRIQKMNEELKAKGYWTEQGRVPIKFFHEKYPYVEAAQ